MADKQRSKREKSAASAWCLRDRLFCVLTAGIAATWAWAATYVSQEQVLTPNSARAMAVLMMPASAAPEMVELRDQIGRQIGAVEGIVIIWRRVMWGVGAFLGLAALLAAITRRCRMLHLLAAAVVLLSTVATLVAMRFLIDPDYGGMEPLATRAHLYVAAVQSAYGFVLLIAFVRKPRAAETVPPMCH